MSDFAWIRKVTHVPRENVVHAIHGRNCYMDRVAQSLYNYNYNYNYLKKEPRGSLT